MNSPISLFGMNLKDVSIVTPLQHVDTNEKALSGVLKDGNVHWTPLKDGGPEKWDPVNPNVSRTFGQVQVYGENAEIALDAINARSKLAVYALSGFSKEASEILNVKECIQTLANAIDASNSFEKKKDDSPTLGKK